MNKFFYLITFFTFSVLKSQTLFTDVFAPDSPTAIEIIGDEMYVGAYAGGYLGKVPLDDPNNVTIVSDNFMAPGGPWKMDYDPNTNTIYTGVIPGIPGCYSIDLDDPLPVDAQSYVDFNFFDSLVIDETILYIAGTNVNGDNGRLYSIDLTLGPSSLELVYIDPQESIRNAAVYDNYLYYGNQDISDPQFTTIYRLDLSDPTPEREYVATVGQGWLQSSFVRGSYLYLALEGNPSSIVRLNLQNPVIPIPQELILTDLSGGIIGLAIHNNILYYNEAGASRIMMYSDPILNAGHLDTPQIEVFPNPANDVIRANSKDGIVDSYRIFNLQGKLLKQDIYNYEIGIQIDELESGMYFMELLSGSYSETIKFIKK